MKRLFVLGGLSTLSASAWLVACIDLTPLSPTPKPDAAAPVVSDAAFDPDAPDVDMRSPCQRCVETPDDAGGCGTELAACTSNATCQSMYECAAALGCLQKPSVRAAITCGLPCAADAGVTDPNDPAVELLLTAVRCANASCPAVCFGGDAGP